MNINDISNFRLINQQIAETEFKTAKDIVGWMGAMQAQDYSMAKWAVGVRLPGSTDKAIQDSVCNGDILRTHLLRPTWHFVSADDIHWMLELTAPQVKASMKSRRKQLGLTDAFLSKTNAIIEKALSSGKHLTRAEIFGALEKAKIHVDSSRAYHTILNAELDGLICSGAVNEKDQTYALLAERAPKKKRLSGNEALAELSIRYFTSHGPATMQDFVWWSGLTVSDAKKGLETAGSDIISEKIGAQTYWFSKSFSPSGIGKEAAYLLPAFDEFIISYKDRSPSLPSESQRMAVSTNGVFRPVIVINGQVAGLWKRTAKKNKAIIETRFFQSPNKKTKNRIEKKVAEYGFFLNRKTENTWNKIDPLKNGGDRP